MPSPRDRQDAIFGWLRARRTTTVGALAEHFGRFLDECTLVGRQLVGEINRARDAYVHQLGS